MDLYICSSIRLHGVTLNGLSTGTTLPFLPFTRVHIENLCGSLFLQDLIVDMNGTSLSGYCNARFTGGIYRMK
jgi:hypothetical protein